jgi:hypothetical protein
MFSFNEVINEGHQHGWPATDRFPAAFELASAFE